MEPEHVKMYSTKEFELLITNSGLNYVGCREVNQHQKIHMGEKK